VDGVYFTGTTTVRSQLDCTEDIYFRVCGSEIVQLSHKGHTPHVTFEDARVGANIGM